VNDNVSSSTCSLRAVTHGHYAGLVVLLFEVVLMQETESSGRRGGRTEEEATERVG